MKKKKREKLTLAFAKVTRTETKKPRKTVESGDP